MRGFRTVDDMESTLTNRELIECVASMKAEDERVKDWEYYASTICSLLYNLLSDPKKCPRKSPKDFMLRQQKPIKLDDSTIMNMLNSSLGGRVEQKE